MKAKFGLFGQEEKSGNGSAIAESLVNSVGTYYVYHKWKANRR